MKVGNFGWALLGLVNTCVVSSYGVMSVDPDTNTLWIEDGAKIEVGEGNSANYWSNGLDFEEVAGGGVIIKSTGDSKKYSFGRYVQVEKNFPYIVFEITDVRRPPQDSYIGYYMCLKTAPWAINPVGQIPKGVFVYGPFLCLEPGGKRTQEFLRMDLYGAYLKFKYIKMVKKPEYYIDISSAAYAARGKVGPGDEVTFKVVMAEPAEDVTIAFYDSYCMPQLEINGQTRFQLKPVDRNPKVWAVTMKITSCKNDRLKKGEQFGAGRLMVGATILGGGIKAPLWTFNPFPFAIKNQNIE